MCAGTNFHLSRWSKTRTGSLRPKKTVDMMSAKKKEYENPSNLPFSVRKSQKVRPNSEPSLLLESGESRLAFQHPVSFHLSKSSPENTGPVKTWQPSNFMMIEPIYNSTSQIPPLKNPSTKAVPYQSLVFQWISKTTQTKFGSKLPPFQVNHGWLPPSHPWKFTSPGHHIHWIVVTLDF